MRIIVPIRGPELDALENEYKKFLKEVKLYGNNPYLIHLIDNEEPFKNILSITFSIIYSSEYLKKENEEIKSLGKRFLSFKSKFIKDFLEIKVNLKNNYSENGIYPIISDLIIRKIALLVNLSYSTKVDFLNGLIFDDNQEYIGKTTIHISTIDFSYEHAIKIKWPNIKKSSIDKTVNWFAANNLHTDGVSKNKLHRAINAFSHLFGHNQEKDSSDLFWIMLGIEALLAEGANNIINQIKTKTSLILGEPEEYKKKLDKLYNYRSRLVHGDYDFPAKFSSDFDEFEDEYWDYLSFATSILLALIRNLINQEKNEYKFEYKLLK